MISSEDYQFLQTHLKAKSGLVLSADKHYLLESRLLPVADRFGLTGIAEIAAKLREPGTTTLSRAVVDAMTTNESFFFRDKTPFEAFETFMLPALLKNRPANQPIRIWCAAASSGQEPYSLAMLLRERAATLAGRQVEIVATDISEEILERARAGIYSQFEVQRGLSAQLLVKYFTKAGEDWQLKPEIREMVKFRSLNLLNSFSGLGVFDTVFCRNVLIYFDLETKADVLKRVAQSLRPDGYLVLGGAETVIGVTDAFTPVPQQRNIYGLSTLPAVAAA